MDGDSEISLALHNDSIHSANLIHRPSVKGLRLYTSSLDCSIVGGYWWRQAFHVVLAAFV